MTSSPQPLVSLGQGTANLQLHMQASMSAVTTVRRFISTFYEGVLSNSELASRLMLACHELLENAVKCASDHQATLRVTVNDCGDAHRLVVSTVNRSVPEHIASLRRLLDEISINVDADQHYQSAMQLSARRTVGSGLGLLRVRAEAEMDITGHISNDLVTIMAHAEARK